MGQNTMAVVFWNVVFSFINIIRVWVLNLAKYNLQQHVLSSSHNNQSVVDYQKQAWRKREMVSEDIP